MRRSANRAGWLLGALAAATLAGCSCQPAPRRPLAADAAVAATGPAPRSAAARRRPAWSVPAGPASLPVAPIVPTRLTRCRADGDCVAVPGDCCGCSAGGAQGVVTGAAQAEFEDARAARCAAAVCVTMLSSDPTCSLVPRCVEGSCRLVPPPPDAGVATTPARQGP
jgi:hypothetical protein